VPDKEGNTIFTRFFGPGAIYSMSPINRDMAIALAQRQSAEPVKQYELPRQIEAPEPEDDPRKEPVEEAIF
jgi:hypothetical protein